MPAERTWKRKLVMFVAYGAAVSFGVAVIIGLVFYTLFSQGLPEFSSVQEYKPKVVTRVYGIDNELVGEFSVERRILIPFDRIPKTFVQAFIASEDDGYFEHEGIDYFGLVRSVVKTMTAKGQQGGSTITMQVAKSFLDPEVRKGAKKKSFYAKARYKGSQIILAQRLESSLSKEDILYLYLNQIYLGHGAYGVQAAAENYFHKNVDELTLSEQALIAGLPQAPSTFSPFAHPERARERQRYVLRRMMEENFITKAQHEQALKEPFKVYPNEDVFRKTAPHFVETVRRHIADKYGEKALYEEGLEVYTTIDMEKQKAAERAVAMGLSDLDKRQGFRGPLLEIAQKDEKAFLEKYQPILEKLVTEKDELQDNTFYLGLVTEVSDQRAIVDIGVKIKAQIPISAMRWARKPNPVIAYEYQLQDSAKKVLKRGDVVFVKPTTKATIIAMKSNKEGPPKFTDDLPFVRLEQEPIAESALFSASPHTGYVHAMVGGYNYDASELNRTMQSCRQPGSSFKPVIYTAAFDHPKLNFSPATILQDSPIVFDDPDNKVRWKPENSHAEFKGDVTVRTAFQMSMNIPAVKTLEKVGMEMAIQYARKLGITTKINRDFGMALGASCVTMWDLSTVYGVYPAQGYKPRYQLIRRVVDREGRVLEDHSHLTDSALPVVSRLLAARDAIFNPREKVLDESTAYVMTRQMMNVVNGGTGFYASRLGKSAAGKTGTTNDQFDAWFMGFTRDMVTGVWVGHDKNERPLGANEFGGRAALPIWTDYMIAALKNVDQPPIPMPEGVVSVPINPETGDRADGTGRSVTEYFKKGTEPKPGQKKDDGNEEFYKADSGL
ncbi:MAG: PBP1A family penicillin-binding protein [Deltaproteobacteria bacterium]|nr:PBP1A family penicillin-binding protein [Deltaproteobacteria bacterium]